jgi:hypothetical protein
MAITKIPAAGFTGNNFRNIIINGDMSIAQRGTSSSITTSGYYTVDRFNMPISNMGTFTVSQSTDTPSGQGFSTSSKYDCTTADASPASGDFIRFEQYVEAQNLQYLKFGTANAQSLTLSFWVKSTKTGTYIAELRNFDGGRTICNSYTINASNTWEKKTITVSGDTDGSGSFNNDNGLGLACIFWLGAGSDFTSGTLQTTWGSVVSANRAVGQVNLADDTANEWYITGVQLEVGSAASDFEFLPYDVNFTRCQRYYQEIASGTYSTIGNGGFQNSGQYRFVHHNVVEMRGSPSLTQTTGSGYYRIEVTGESISSFTAEAHNGKSQLIYNDSVTGTQGDFSTCKTNNASALLALEAEL